MNPSLTLAGKLTALGLAASVLAGCAWMSVSSYTERGIDIQRYHTYNWGPPDTLETGDPRLDNNRFFDERMRTAVERGLADRGFEKATSGTPDLLVHYHASVTQKIDLRNVDKAHGYCEHADCRPSVYEAGTVFVDLIDPRSDTLIWRGWAEGGMDGVIEHQDWMEARIDEAVARILERLPRRVSRQGARGTLSGFSAAEEPRPFPAQGASARVPLRRSF